MLVSSAVSYFVNEAIAKARYGNAADMNFEKPLTSLVWLTSIVSIVLTYIVSFLMVPELGGDTSLWWKLATIISCGTLAGAVIPELVKIFTSTSSRHVQEVVTSSREAGVAEHSVGPGRGKFLSVLAGHQHRGLDGPRLYLQHVWSGCIDGGAGSLRVRLVAFGFLGMGPVTIAVDSYGPVTDNAQSVYELSLIEQEPNIVEELKRDYNMTVVFERAKHLLEENDGAGNTFKATAKPVLIGTAVVERRR